MALRLWQQLQQWRRAPGAPAASDGACTERSNAELTTLPAPSRGQALRAAWRTLRQRMDSRPAMRQVLPHLAAIERALGRHGSRALRKLPVPVLHRGLTQLTLLQDDDDSPLDAANLRVLRLRLIEAIALRSAPATGSPSAPLPNQRPAHALRRGPLAAPRGFAPSSHLGSSTLAHGMEVSEVPAELFDEAEGSDGMRRH